MRRLSIESVVFTLSWCALLSSTLGGCSPRVMRVKLDLNANHPATVAPIELEEGGSRHKAVVDSLDVPRPAPPPDRLYNDDDLRALQKTLEKSTPAHEDPEESLRIHLVVRAGVALRGAARDEVAPGPRIPGLLNRLPGALCEERRVETRRTRVGLDFDAYLTRRSGMA